MELQLAPSPTSSRDARTRAVDAVVRSGREDLADDVATLVSELVSNAVIHARTQMRLTVELAGAGVRVELADESAAMPRFAGAGLHAISGRGLLIIDRLASRWGVQRLSEGGKAVWVEIDEPATDHGTARDEEDLLGLWVDDAEGTDEPPSDAAVAVRVDIDVEALVQSIHDTDSQIRDMQLLGLTPESATSSTIIAPDLVEFAQSLELSFVHFSDARRQIQTQALAAQRSGLDTMTLELHLERDAGLAAQRFLDALEAADALTAAGVLLVPPSTQALRDVRRYYVESIVGQLGRSER